MSWLKVGSRWMPRETGFLNLLSDDARKVLTFGLFKIGALSVTPIFLVKGLIYLGLLSLASATVRNFTPATSPLPWIAATRPELAAGISRRRSK